MRSEIDIETTQSYSKFTLRKRHSSVLFKEQLRSR